MRRTSGMSTCHSCMFMCKLAGNSKAGVKLKHIKLYT